MDGGHGERKPGENGEGIKVFTDPEGCDEYTIKVVHRKKVVKLLLSCPERLCTLHSNVTGRLTMLFLLKKIRQ